MRGTGAVLFVDLHGILIPEGRLTDKEFVHEDAKGPPVYCCAVTWLLLVLLIDP